MLLPVAALVFATLAGLLVAWVLRRRRHIHALRDHGVDTTAVVVRIRPWSGQYGRRYVDARVRYTVAADGAEREAKLRFWQHELPVECGDVVPLRYDPRRPHAVLSPAAELSGPAEHAGAAVAYTFIVVFALAALVLLLAAAGVE